MRKTLREFKIGEKGTVIEIGGSVEMKRRMIDMGITKGAVILMKKTAPLGDPLEIYVRGYHLALSKTEAEQVLMEVLP